MTRLFCSPKTPHRLCVFTTNKSFTFRMLHFIYIYIYKDKYKFLSLVPAQRSMTIFVRLLVLWESPPSIWFRIIRKPKCTSLVRDSRIRDWLWPGKVLAPLAHPI
jgi:hypothetical protein